MAKRSTTKVSGDINKVSSDTLDIQPPVPYTKVEQSAVVVCNFPATMKLVGKVSGKQYVWKGAGTTIEVDRRDVPDILSKKMGTSVCCGGVKSSPLFEVV